MYYMQEAIKPIDPAEPEVKRKALRALLWLGIVSIIMLFGGLTSAYIVRQGEGKWVEFALPQLFKVSSVIIILSSISMQWGIAAIKKNNVKLLKVAMFMTVVLGSGFIFSQYYAWSELYQKGIVFTGRISDIKTDFQYVPSGKETVAEVSDAGNVAGSFLYVLTGLHVMHLIVGVIALIIVFSRALLGKYTLANYNGVKMCAIYWHFLGGLWLYLFFFLLYIR
jgi:cytochrome c oxidase subunit 3